LTRLLTEPGTFEDAEIKALKQYHTERIAGCQRAQALRPDR